MICKDDGMAQAEDLRVSNLFKTLRFHQSNKNYSSTRAQSRRKEKIKTFPAFFQRKTEWKNERWRKKCVIENLISECCRVVCLPCVRADDVKVLFSSSSFSSLTSSCHIQFLYPLSPSTRDDPGILHLNFISFTSHSQEVTITFFWENGLNSRNKKNAIYIALHKAACYC